MQFYQRWASLEVLEPPKQTMGTKTVGLGEKGSTFVLSLIESANVETIQANFHLGFGCKDREHMTKVVAEATKAGIVRLGPMDMGPPLGFWVILSDPDGHPIELSYGQQMHPQGNP
jgi:catechol-2,3-dioxygenase